MSKHLGILGALVTLVYTFNEGIMLDRLSEIENGHREMLEWNDERCVALSPRVG